MITVSPRLMASQRLVEPRDGDVCAFCGTFYLEGEKAVETASAARDEPPTLTCLKCHKPPAKQPKPRAKPMPYRTA